jgi:hypothetical protein
MIFEFCKPKRKSNQYRLIGDHVEMTLGGGAKCIFDKDQLEKISNFYWFLNNRGYVATVRLINGKKEYILMHRLIMEFPVDIIDHKNMNKVDNRKENLRVCSRGMNSVNSKKRRIEGAHTKYKNVWTVNPKNSKNKSSYFVGVLTKDGRIYKKSFRLLSEAVDWTNSKGFELWGDFYKKQVFNYGDEVIMEKAYKGFGSKRVGKLGFYGVKKHRGKYVAMFNHAYKRHWIKVCKTPEEASVAYDEYLIKNNLIKDGHKLNKDIKNVNR